MWDALPCLALMLHTFERQGIIGTCDDATKNPANLKGDGKGEAALLTKLKNNLSAPKTWTIKGVEVANAFSMTGVKDKYEGARGQGGFKVEHYAANVIYDVEEWCEKNNDKISACFAFACNSGNAPRFFYLTLSLAGGAR